MPRKRFRVGSRRTAINGGRGTARASGSPSRRRAASISEFLARDVAAPAIALVNSFGALGAFAGSYFVGWLDDLTGDSSASFLLLAGSLAAAAVLMLFVRPPRLRESRTSEPRFVRTEAQAPSTSPAG